MWKEQTIILNEQDQIVYVGEKTLQLLDRSKATPFAYPAGKLEKGDILVYFCKKRDAIAVNYDILGISSKGLEKIEKAQGENFVLVCEIGNDSVAPIVKGGIDFNGENAVFTDTIYEGQEISVVTKGENLVFTVNEQVLQWNFSEVEGCAVVIDGFGIKFFGCDKTDGGCELAEVLSSGCFDALLNLEYIYGKRMQDILHVNVLAAVSQMKGNVTEKFFDFKGRAIRIRKERLESIYGGITAYVFEDEEVMTEIMFEESDAYRRLITSDSANFIRKQSVTMFRLFGSHEKMKETERLLQKGSNTNTTILLTGESGTGKTFLAREIHKNSKRNEGPFVHVNCAAIPYQLIESELFGYEDGAFTGARKGGKKGYFEMSSGGTLFLDEITEIPVSLQGKLLEVLQNKTFYRVGGTKKLETNIRVIAATNRDLKKEIEEKRFREDLYYRINVFPVEIPPLRERAESIYEIISDILPDICSRLEIEPLIVSSQALEKMEKYSWPGNIRELENVLEKAAILCDGRMILPDDVVLPEENVLSPGGKTMKEIREKCEREAIVNALARFKGDKEQAARELDIGRTNMFDKIKKYGICSKEWE